MSDESKMQNYVRELQKAYDVLKMVKHYLHCHAEANATLHMAEHIQFSPLHDNVAMALNGIKAVLKTRKKKLPQVKLEVPEE